MAKRTRVVIGGVDTHGRTHHAAVIDQHGRLLADAEFGAHTDGYRQLLWWLGRHGRLCSVGVEGTGTYGAGLTRFLLDHGVHVLEADRPNRKTRRQRGKSDPIDAEAAARAVLAGSATALPKRRDGIVEAIRVLRGVRAGAVKARTAAINQLKAVVVTAPAAVREPLDGRSTARQVTACTRLRPDPEQLADPTQATKAALRSVAVRILALEQEIKVADQRLRELVPKAAPRTLGLLAIGVEHAGQLLVTAGDNRERLRGERDANCALHLAVVVRMRYCPRTRAYVERRTKEGLSKPEIMRCVKRYLAREVYHAILADFQALHAT